MVVAMDENLNTAFGFGRMDDGRIQKLGQTFVSPASGLKLASLSTNVVGKGTLVIKIYEIGEKAPFGTLLTTIEVPVDDYWGEPGAGWHVSRIRPALRMNPEKRYSFILRVAGGQRSLAAAAGRGYGRGQLWCYCPVTTGGEVGDPKWQSAKKLDGSSIADLGFRLRFWRAK